MNELKTRLAFEEYAKKYYLLMGCEKGSKLETTDLIYAIVAIHDVIYHIDDGYHNEDVEKLIKVSNNLYAELDQEHQEKLTELLSED